GRWPAPADAPVEGTWEIHTDGGRFSIDPEPASPDDGPLPELKTAKQAVTFVEYAAIWRIVENCSHILAFHSALLSKDGRSVAIVGPSEAGKSTLSTALWKSGWTFLCDDMTMVSGTRATPGPRRVSLREGSRSLVGEELWQSVEKKAGYVKTLAGCLFHPTEAKDAEQSVELSAVIFLRRNGAPQDTVGPTRLVPANAAISLMPYTNLVRHLSFPEALAPIAELMSVVPAWDLPRAPLPEMIESVERLAGFRAV
ncbi:MAG TPA: hypothetical protein VFX40_03000, partial [Gemmatimonadaceae bacterium]|nr:hypothetical protein [Gemmatimonadaceae bacterium]